MERMAKFSSDDFDQWAFAISRRLRVPHGKRICRTADRFDPTGMPRPRCCVRRVPPPSPAVSYMKYCNGARTHLSLEKDAPFSRAVERAGQILCRPILGGLHHQYVRI